MATMTDRELTEMREEYVALWEQAEAASERGDSVEYERLHAEFEGLRAAYDAECEAAEREERSEPRSFA